MTSNSSPSTSLPLVDGEVPNLPKKSTPPLIILGTESNKVHTQDGGYNICVGTTKSKQITTISSREELIRAFGDPLFDSYDGSPTNEYGLLSAYSYLSNNAPINIVRADIDLKQLKPSKNEPRNSVPIGSYWFNINDSIFGLHSLQKDPYDPSNLIWSPVDISYGFDDNADNSIGQDGEYAVIGIGGTVKFLKKRNGVWLDLYRLTNNGRLINLVASAVYPNTSEYGTAEGDAYWLKTSSSGYGSLLDVSVLDENYIFNKVNVPLYDENAIITNVTTHALPYFTTSRASEISIYHYNGVISSEIGNVYASMEEPRGIVEDGSYWYNNSIDVVDILVNDGNGSWVNIHLPNIDYTEYSGDVSSIRLYVQSDDPKNNNTIMDNDLWIDSNNSEFIIYKFHRGGWRYINLSDNVTPNGIIFGDARSSPLSTVNGYSATGINNGGGTAPNLDYDAPDPNEYPSGMLLFNTRYSSRNVKQWKSNHTIYYSNNIAVTDGRWVSVSGNDSSGMPNFGDLAQRYVIVQKMNEAIAQTHNIDSIDIDVSVIATPGFIECISAMESLNELRDNTALVIGDCPFELSHDEQELITWASNLSLSNTNSINGLVTRNNNTAVYYPCLLSTDTSGESVVMPPSHAVLSVIGYNDKNAQPWSAPAGLSRGKVNNASAIGYVSNGKFKEINISRDTRDSLYELMVNPIHRMEGVGIVIYGQKTRSHKDDIHNRINVARTTHYIKYRARKIAEYSLYESNDEQTLSQVKASVDTFLSDMVTNRAIEAFNTICDSSNNDLSLSDGSVTININYAPITALEFIYIDIHIDKGKPKADILPTERAVLIEPSAPIHPYQVTKIEIPDIVIICSSIFTLTASYVFKQLTSLVVTEDDIDFRWEQTAGSELIDASGWRTPSLYVMSDPEQFEDLYFRLYVDKGLPTEIYADVVAYRTPTEFSAITDAGHPLHGNSLTIGITAVPNIISSYDASLIKPISVGVSPNLKYDEQGEVSYNLDEWDSLSVSITYTPLIFRSNHRIKKVYVLDSVTNQVIATSSDRIDLIDIPTDTNTFYFIFDVDMNVGYGNNIRTGTYIDKRVWSGYKTARKKEQNIKTLHIIENSSYFDNMTNNYAPTTLNKIVSLPLTLSFIESSNTIGVSDNAINLSNYNITRYSNINLSIAADEPSSMGDKQHNVTYAVININRFNGVNIGG